MLRDAISKYLLDYTPDKGNLVACLQKNFPRFIFDASVIEQLINNDISEADIATTIVYCLEVQDYINTNRIHSANATTLNPYDVYHERYPFRFDEVQFMMLFNAVCRIDISNKYLYTSNKANSMVELLNSFPISTDDKASIVDSIVRKDEGWFPKAGRLMVDAGFEDYELIGTYLNKLEIAIRKEKIMASEILSELYYDCDNSDASIETCFVFDRFLTLAVYENITYLAFINPSPYFVKRCLASNLYINKYVTFFFENECFVSAFHSRSSNSNFSFKSFNDLRKNMSHISLFDGVFVFGNETDDRSFINKLLYHLKTSTYHDTKLAIFDADTYIIKNSDTKKILEDIKIDSIELLPFSIKGLKEPKRKSIIELTIHKHFRPDDVINVFEYKTVTDGKYPGISVKYDVLYITQKEFIELTKTIRKLYHESASGNTTERRKSYSYSFSPELIIDYSSSGTDTTRIRACFREPNAKSSKGHKILNTQISAVLKPSVDIESWLTNTYPFLKHEEKGVLSFARDNMIPYRTMFVTKKSISLRTLLYLYPEAEDGLLEKYKPIIKTVMLHDLSAILINVLSMNDIEIIAHDISSDYSELTGYRMILDTLSKIFEFANKQGYKNSNPAKQLIKEQSPNEYTPFDIKQNLGRNHLDRGQRAQFIKCCSKIKKSKPSLYLAVMLRYITALLPQEICGLKWKDYCQVYDFNVLKISRLISKDAKEFIPLKTRTQYRNIPVPPQLNRLIVDEKESQLKRYKCTEEQLMEMSIVAGKDGIIDGCFAAMSPERLYKESRSIINSLDNNEDIIWITDNDTKYEIDLSATPGDIFRSNYKHFAATKSIFEDDVAYFLMGIQNKDVFSYNYCDFNNHECLKLIYPDQCKLEEVILDGKNI